MSSEYKPGFKISTKNGRSGELCAIFRLQRPYTTTVEDVSPDFKTITVPVEVTTVALNEEGLRNKISNREASGEDASQETEALKALRAAKAKAPALK